MIADGLSEKQVAHELGLKPTTVRTQVWAATKRLNVHSALQAVLVCVREGWIDANPRLPQHATGAIRLAERLRRIERRLARMAGNDVTPAQRAYLKDFDSLLRASVWTDDDEAATLRSRMREHLDVILEECGLTSIRAT